MNKAILLALCIPATALADVVRLEYMRIIGSSQSVGAWLLTDYVPKSNTVVRAKYTSSSASASNNNQFLFCSRLTEGAAANILNFNFAPNVGGKFRFDYYATQAAASSSFTADRAYELLVSGGKAYVTDTVTGSVTEIGPGLQSFVPQYKMMLFQSYSYNDGAYSGRGNSFHGKFYYLKIYEIEDGEEVLKHDFVPCLEGGVVKLCDLADADKPRHALTLDSGASVLPPKEYTIEAPGGVGDVEALTNALVAINSMAADANGRFNARVWLKPGVYDLCGVYMTTTTGSGHLVTESIQGGMIAGLGEGPEDTILLGGGEADGRRVLYTSGSNYDWMTISNWTVTGGWTTGDGGGICGNGTTRYSHLIVSNNYAAGSNQGGGGGCMHGRAECCLFADNRVGTGTKYGGAFYTSGGGGQQANFVQGAWHCTFSNNVCGNAGGALRLKGKCIDCTFVNNKANNGGAVNCGEVDWSWFLSHFTNSTEILDCKFIGNTLSAWGHGSAIYNAASVGIPISNCVFTANDATVGGYGVIYKGNLCDCVVTNNVRDEQIFYNCNLSRCYVADNHSTYQGNVIDGVSDTLAYACTNSNCIFLNNIQEKYGCISSRKIVVNCTYVGNVTHGGANYGDICRRCRMWNTVLDKNYQDKGKDPYYWCDVRAHDLNGDQPLVMTNCVFGRADSYTTLDANGYVTNAGVANTRKVSDVKFADAANGDYTPTTRSAAYNAGCQEPWILALLGEKDLAGNPRVYGGALDIGAYECQKNRPGAMLLVR